VSGTSFAAPQVAGVLALDAALGQRPVLNGGVVYAGAPPVTPEPTEAVTEAATEAVVETATEAATVAVVAPTVPTPTLTPQPIPEKYAGLVDEAQKNGHVRLIVG